MGASSFLESVAKARVRMTHRQAFRDLTEKSSRPWGAPTGIGISTARLRSRTDTHLFD